MADIVAKFDPGDVLTLTASAAINGGQLVTITGDRRVGPAGAGATPFGVALRDAAAEAEVPVQRNGVFRLRAAVAVAAGALVMTAAAGEVTPVPASGALAADDENTRDIVGVALEAIAAGVAGLVALKIT